MRYSVKKWITLKYASSGHGWHGLVWLTMDDMPSNSKIFCLCGTSHLKGHASLARFNWSLTHKYGANQRVANSPWWLCQPPFSSWPPNQHPRNIRLNNYTRWRDGFKVVSYKNFIFFAKPLMQKYAENAFKEKQNRTEDPVCFLTKVHSTRNSTWQPNYWKQNILQKRRNLGKPNQIRSGT